eukprot:CAMPEP_0198327294 /NCGR_PEP_ID=MMETSP1450-20131203/14596_1 /TAXON_ID=753684 ORGANISM="Madagascaria erythrocladiodes, Strain CCMP3234" /NCGR_SAMPLE_ID=MMETSP1450 /ASSEMBLY_ACC=CAM_ASM_001115 /LENGTH=92 /DNA_ID=CAMNT_0044031335 /DNA_START=91 /DNA_END=367 /DNA_ORIENTATION=+
METVQYGDEVSDGGGGAFREVLKHSRNNSVIGKDARRHAALYHILITAADTAPSGCSRKTISSRRSTPVATKCDTLSFAKNRTTCCATTIGS